MTHEQMEQPDTRRIRRWAWMVCLVIISLMLGFVAGYYLRPVLDEPGAEARGKSAPPTKVAESQDANPPSSLMEAAIKRTRQWKGDTNAPVTIVEFGDFQ
jgi:hypothetical protein